MYTRKNAPAPGGVPLGYGGNAFPDAEEYIKENKGGNPWEAAPPPPEPTRLPPPPTRPARKEPPPCESTPPCPPPPAPDPCPPPPPAGACDGDCGCEKAPHRWHLPQLFGKGGFVPLGSLFGGEGGFRLTEEDILLIAIALLLFFSSGGDRTGALMVLALLLIR